jgi:hypothetical protein
MISERLSVSIFILVLSEIIYENLFFWFLIKKLNSLSGGKRLLIFCYIILRWISKIKMFKNLYWATKNYLSLIKKYKSIKVFMLNWKFFHISIFMYEINHDLKMVRHQSTPESTGFKIFLLCKEVNEVWFEIMKYLWKSWKIVSNFHYNFLSNLPENFLIN